MRAKSGVVADRRQERASPGPCGEQAHGGAVTLIQRFGSAANLNIHLYCLVLDGVYRRTDGDPVFVEVSAPIDEALQALLHKIISRLDVAADPVRRARRGGGIDLSGRW
jgi:hypothetical protein